MVKIGTRAGQKKYSGKDLIMDRKDMDIASNAWGKFFSTEEGKKWKEEMFSHPTKEEVEDIRKASEELRKYSIYGKKQ